MNLAELFGLIYKGKENGYNVYENPDYEKEMRDRCYLKEFECENFEVIKLAITSPTFKFILKPKNKTNEELQNLFPDDDFVGNFPFREYTGRYLVEYTPEQQFGGIKLKDLIDNKKGELNAL